MPLLGKRWSINNLYLLSCQFLIRREKYLVNGINNAIMGAESWLTCGMALIVLVEGPGPMLGLESLTSDQGLCLYCGQAPST